MKNGKSFLILIIAVLLISWQPSGAGVVWPLGSLEINGSPVGMEIDIDGENYGGMPVDGSLLIESISATNHEITGKKPGYKSETKQIEIFENETAKVNFFLQMSPPGSLEVISNPQNVKVFIDEKYSGITPIIISDLYEGKYELKLSLDHYQDNLTSVEIKSGEITNINAVLEPVDNSNGGKTKGSPGFGVIISVLVLVMAVFWFGNNKP